MPKLAVAALVTFLLMAAAAPIYRPGVLRATSDEPVLVVSVLKESGHLQAFGGPVFLAWSDGLVISYQDWSLYMMGDQDLTVGRIGADRVRSMLEEVRASGFLDVASPQKSAQERPMRIGALVNGQAKVHEWNERFGRSAGMRVDADPEFRRFVEMWQSAKVAIAFAHPADNTPMTADPEARRRFAKAKADGFVPAASGRVPDRTK